jgi:type IV pilus assembly protein PilN
MRLDLNLATQPYEEVRRFFRHWVPLVAAVAVATVLLVVLAVSNWWRSREPAQQVAEVRRQIAQVESERAEAMSVLSLPEHQATRTQAEFLNSLIAHKAFSWTQVFSDLEKIVPPRVQVTSIRPEVNAANQLEINMKVAGDSRDRAVELVRNMEKSERFRQPQIRMERIAVQQAMPIEFEVVAIYVPQARAAAPTAGGGD